MFILQPGKITFKELKIALFQIRQRNNEALKNYFDSIVRA